MCHTGSWFLPSVYITNLTTKKSIDKISKQFHKIKSKQDTMIQINEIDESNHSNLNYKQKWLWEISFESDEHNIYNPNFSSDEKTILRHNVISSIVQSPT